ncbi:MAG: ATP-dependent Clp protease ATP-binding subunit [Clostridia bacterium]|nr:ATP-dependent Clp protease ATP-binding subunit [Clostridia bacterium]
MLCNICKKNPAVIFSSKEENGKRIMEGLCIDCAKKQGINTDEILKAQTDAQAKNINNGLEGLFKNLAESLNNIDGLEFDAMAFPDMGNMNFNNQNQDDEDYEDEEGENNQRPPIFAGAIPLGSIFGNLSNFKQNNGQDEISGNGNVKKKVKPEKKKSANKRKKYLDTYGTNLTVKAKNGELDMVVGRDKELQRVVQILNRRTKNNPCLIGEPGVGKTAIAQGLAIKIANQKVPVKLLNKEVYLLDMTAVLAGTQFRGQFEARMKGIIEECIHYGNIILVIDEVHSIIGAGAGGENDSMNAANILKPALANGQIQLIGTTTIKEYRKYIEKDTALERRFQQVMIDEPSTDDSIGILSGIKKYYEDYHKVKISNEVIKQTVLMSEKYIHDRFLPDKAIDILDEACSRINLENVDLFRLEVLKNKLKEIQEQKEDAANADSTEDYQKAAQLKTEECKLIEEIDKLNSTMKIKSLTVQDIAGVIESWTKIPVKKITEKETQKLLNLEENLHKRIIGQEDAVSAVARAIRRNRAGLKSTQRPPSFIFVGPTGVGKTELAKSLAYEMFGTEESIIRIDMSEYMESNSTAKLIGAPPGYVGYDDAGQLTEKVKRKPYSIILLDEIEKAHPDVFNLLLQILDDGRLTDSQGNTVSFQNTIIIMTSNAGSNLNNNSIGFGNETVDKGKIEDRLKDTFRPEFLNRVDEIIVFNSLNKEQLLQIVDLMLNDTKKVLLEKDISLQVSKEAKEFILEKGTNLKFGARPLRRAIQRYVEDEISEKILRGEIKNGQTITINCDDDKLIIVGD